MRQTFWICMDLLSTRIVFLPFLSIILLATMSASDAAVNVKGLEKIADGSVKFCTSLYRVLSKKDGNIFISPFSLEVVLALAYMGAKGQTAQEIASALHLPADREDILKGFASLMSTLKSSENVTLEVANKVYTQKNYKILDEFRQISEKRFLSGAQELDFANGEASRQIINSWVEEKTKNKIKDLIPSGLLNDLTRLVLVNAIYFKGLWVHQFDEKRTKPEKFYLNSKESKEVPMMNKKAKFGYAESEELNAQILEMPYQGDQNLSMFVILPNDIDGIAKLEEKLITVDLRNILGGLFHQEVIVTMPKFKLEETTDFNDILQQAGMPTMFNENAADFSGISGSKDLYVSKVLQKAFIEVNEKGSEAAAATGLIAVAMCLPPPPKQFRADHPFHFVLMGKGSVVLFMGRLSQPQ